MIYFCFFVCSGSFSKAKKTSKTYAPKTPQILKKNTSTPSKIDAKNHPKSNPRRPKIDFWRGPQKNPFSEPEILRSWGTFWGVLGLSWERLGRVLGLSWGRLGNLGASWARLEAVLRCLGDVLARISLPRQLENDF